jgi:hypothetical protein
MPSVGACPLALTEEGAKEGPWWMVGLPPDPSPMRFTPHNVAAVFVFRASLLDILPVHFGSYLMPIGMAWFYNLFLSCFSGIGLVASSRRHHDPADTMGHKSAFFLGNSLISKNRAPQKSQKPHFRMACFTRPISSFFGMVERQFGRF